MKNYKIISQSYMQYNDRLAALVSRKLALDDVGDFLAVYFNIPLEIHAEWLPDLIGCNFSSPTDPQLFFYFLVQCYQYLPNSLHISGVGHFDYLIRVIQSLMPDLRSCSNQQFGPLKEVFNRRGRTPVQQQFFDNVFQPLHIRWCELEVATTKLVPVKPATRKKPTRPRPQIIEKAGKWYLDDLPLPPGKTVLKFCVPHHRDVASKNRPAQVQLIRNIKQEIQNRFSEIRNPYQIAAYLVRKGIFRNIILDKKDIHVTASCPFRLFSAQEPEMTSAILKYLDDYFCESPPDSESGFSDSVSSTEMVLPKAASEKTFKASAPSVFYHFEITSVKEKGGAGQTFEQRIEDIDKDIKRLSQAISSRKSNRSENIRQKNDKKSEKQLLLDGNNGFKKQLEESIQRINNHFRPLCYSLCDANGCFTAESRSVFENIETHPYAFLFLSFDFRLSSEAGIPLNEENLSLVQTLKQRIDFLKFIQQLIRRKIALAGGFDFPQIATLIKSTVKKSDRLDKEQFLGQMNSLRKVLAQDCKAVHHLYAPIKISLQLINRYRKFYPNLTEALPSLREVQQFIGQIITIQNHLATPKMPPNISRRAFHASLTFLERLSFEYARQIDPQFQCFSAAHDLDFMISLIRNLNIAFHQKYPLERPVPLHVIRWHANGTQNGIDTFEKKHGPFPFCDDPVGKTLSDKLIQAESRRGHCFFWFYGNQWRRFKDLELLIAIRNNVPPIPIVEKRAWLPRYSTVRNISFLAAIVSPLIFHHLAQNSTPPVRDPLIQPYDPNNPVSLAGPSLELIKLLPDYSQITQNILRSTEKGGPIKDYLKRWYGFNNVGFQIQGTKYDLLALWHTAEPDINYSKETGFLRIRFNQSDINGLMRKGRLFLAANTSSETIILYPNGMVGKAVGIEGSIFLKELYIAPGVHFDIHRDLALSFDDAEPILGTLYINHQRKKGILFYKKDTGDCFFYESKWERSSSVMPPKRPDRIPNGFGLIRDESGYCEYGRYADQKLVEGTLDFQCGTEFTGNITGSIGTYTLIGTIKDPLGIEFEGKFSSSELTTFEPFGPILIKNPSEKVISFFVKDWSPYIRAHPGQLEVIGRFQGPASLTLFENFYQIVEFNPEKKERFAILGGTYEHEPYFCIGRYSSNPRSFKVDELITLHSASTSKSKEIQQYALDLIRNKKGITFYRNLFISFYALIVILLLISIYSLDP